MSIHRLIDSFDVWADEKTRYRVEILQKEEDNSFGYLVFAFCQIKDADDKACSCTKRIFSECGMDSNDTARKVAISKIEDLLKQ